jgi:hypothetical protein
VNLRLKSVACQKNSVTLRGAEDKQYHPGSARSIRLVSHAARIWAGSKIIDSLRTIPDCRRVEYCKSLEKQVVLSREELTGRMPTCDEIGIMCPARITFGSHTTTHPVASQVMVEEMEHKIFDSKNCGSAALPIPARCGCRTAATTLEGIYVPEDNPYRLRRVSFGEERSFPMFAFRSRQLFLSCGPEDSATASAGSSLSRAEPMLYGDRDELRRRADDA